MTLTHLSTLARKYSNGTNQEVKNIVYLNLAVTGSSSRLIFLIFNGLDSKLNELKKNSHNSCKMDRAFVQSGVTVQSGCRKILLGTLETPAKRCSATLHLSLLAAQLREGLCLSTKPKPGRVSRPWTGWLHPEAPRLLGVGGPCQWAIVPASLASFTFSPPFSPHLFYKQAFQENSALQGAVPSDMLSELCYPG